MSMGQCLAEAMQKRQFLSSGKLYKVTLLLCEIPVYTYIHRDSLLVKIFTRV